MRSDQLKLGSILSYLQMALNILISIIYTPTMIRLLGKSEYGLYNTVISTISMLAVLNLGFSSSYVRFFMKYHTKGDKEGEFELNGLYMAVFTVIGIVALLCGIFLSNNLEIIFKNGLTESEYSLAKVLTVLLSINMAVSFPMSVFSSIVTAHEKYVYLKAVACIKTVFSPLLMIAVLFMGYRSVAMVVITIAVNLVADALYIYYVFHILKVGFIFKGFDMPLFKSIFAYSGFIAINIIVDQLNNNVDKLLIGRYLGTAAVTVYSVGFMLYTSFTSFSSAISSVFIPKVHRIINIVADEKEQNNALTALFIKVGRVQFYVLALISSGLLFFGMPFIRLWAKIEEYKSAYYVALFLIIPAMVPLCQNLGIEIQRAKNLHRFRAVAYLIMAVLNIFVTVFLCKAFGVVGAACGTAIALITANGFIINIYYHKRVGIDVLKYWKNIIRISFGLIPPCIFGMLIGSKANINSYIDILKYGAVYAILYFISMWIISMNCFEKKLITDGVKKLAGKGKNWEK